MEQNMLDLDKARKEIKEKTYREIETATAWTWASRACVYYEGVEDSGNTLWAWTVAEEAYHEAIEHSALAEDDGGLLKKIKKAVEPYQEKAAEFMYDNLRYGK
jgi:hypothetical protein